MTAKTRMNVGCGPCIAPGWINVDRRPHPGVDLTCDVRDGIPLAGARLDAIVAIHVLQDLPYADVLPALVELRRLLRTGGTLRLALPDLEKAVEAYRGNDPRYFYVPDCDAQDIGAKLITQLVWYGSVRTPMIFGFIRELLARAGFSMIHRCAFGRTMSGDLELVSLDNRERESFFVEAVR